MKEMARILIVVGMIAALISCGFEGKGIELIKEKSGLELPPIYEILKNESIESESIDGDFSVFIELEFDEENFKLLERSIAKDSLGRWTEIKTGRRFNSNDKNEPTIIELDRGARILKFEMHHI